MGRQQDLSSLTVRTIDGLRVALAGLPDGMPVDVEGLVLDVMNVGDLRALERLPQPVYVRIGYHLAPDSRVQVSPAE